VKRASAILLALLLLVCGFSLASVLQPRAVEWNKRGQSGGVLKVMFGEGRRLFANHFFKQADVYFHSGFYPSIFDEAKAADSKHLTETHGDHEEGEEKCELDFLRPPRDWVQAFGRRFTIHEHTHLEKGKEREILPWLRLSADLDPQRIDTYTVAAYWLQNMGRVKEAEEFLREGLKNNPQSYEILFELGTLYDGKRGDFVRAENLYAAALRRWLEQEKGKKEPDLMGFEKITYRLGYVEEKNGKLQQALEHFELARKVTPNPQELEQHIAELRARLAGTPQP
jgi:tetratricopeptide (TPR) repeat protein